MIQKFFHRVLLRRHYWRHASFSEVAELYSSRLMRMLAINLAASFMSIYLFQNGYSVVFIALFWAAFYLFKVFLALPAAAIVGWFGPKHAILASNILFIPSMVAFALIPQYGAWLLPIVGIFQALSTTLYMTAYRVDFSKVKSRSHAGKEIAFMHMIEKVTAGLSPLVGGALAFIVGPEVVLSVSAVLFALAAAPLFRTAEPVKPKQKLQFKGFPWHLIRGMGVAQWAYGFDVFSSATVWSLFVAIFVIGVTDSNEVYLANGILMSVVVVAGVVSAYVYGKLIDGKRGGDLMHVAVIGNALTHCMRPFIGSPVTAAGLNVVNEAATSGYVMPYTRGVFDNADLSGRRIAYVGLLEVLGNLGALAGALAVAGLVSVFGDFQGLQGYFFLTAAVVLLILTARFPLYRRG